MKITDDDLAAMIEIVNNNQDHYTDKYKRDISTMKPFAFELFKSREREKRLRAALRGVVGLARLVLAFHPFTNRYLKIEMEEMKKRWNKT